MNKMGGDNGNMRGRYLYMNYFKIVYLYKYL